MNKIFLIVADDGGGGDASGTNNLFAVNDRNIALTLVEAFTRTNKAFISMCKEEGIQVIGQLSLHDMKKLARNNNFDFTGFFPEEWKQRVKEVDHFLSFIVNPIIFFYWEEVNFYSSDNK